MGSAKRQDDSTGKDFATETINDLEYQKIVVTDDEGDILGTIGNPENVTVSNFPSVQTVVNQKPNTPTVTTISSVLVSTLFLAENLNRKGFLIFNNSTATLYIKFGTGVSSASFSVKISANGYFEAPQPCYTGVVYGIWSAANGEAQITEVQ